MTTVRKRLVSRLMLPPELRQDHLRIEVAGRLRAHTVNRAGERPGCGGTGTHSSISSWRR